MNETINRYKQEMATLIRDKNKDIDRLRQYTERMEAEEEIPSPPPVEELGTLTVIVTDEKTMTPINKASVTITTETEPSELSAFVFTNEMGRVSVQLKTNTTYTVTVTADGYDTLIFNGVIVLKDEIKELPVTLQKSDLIYNNGALALAAAQSAINRFKEKQCCVFPIRLGDCGECVMSLQNALVTLSNVFDFSPPRPSGNFGQNTVTAVGKIQRLFSLPVTYCVDEITWEAIFASADALTMTPDDETPKMCITFPQNKILSLGDKGDDVMFLQLSLNKLSGRFCNISVSQINGVFDKQTECAVMTLQKILALPVTGRVGQGTMRAILKI